MKPIRLQFADTVLRLGKDDNDLVVMVGDISHGIFKPFAEKYPDRYYNIGICEPSMVNMGSGLSKVGLTPIIHTIAPFLIDRSYEQIKLDFGYQSLPVNLVSVGGSFDYSQLGCSHHTYNDVSMICHIKNSKVFIPGSPIEFDILFSKEYKNNQINYFRLVNNSHGLNFKEKDIITGKAIKVKQGSDLTIVTMGYHLKTVMKVVEYLQTIGKSIEVLYYHTIKPFDYKTLKASILKTKRVLSVEELSSHDGIFNQVLKTCIDMDSVKLKQVAVNDFIHGYGSFDYLCQKVGLDKESLIKYSLELI